MTAADFYQTHLDRVSRSFAFCIRQLPSPLREWVGLSYLLCRTVDTIEDSTWPRLEDQMQMFARFDRALDEPGAAGELANCLDQFPSDASESEKLLVKDSARLLEDFHRLPEPVYAMIRGSIHSMSLGMQHFRKASGGGPLRLQSLEEVNQYCFFVAGVVGELLAKLLARVEPAFAVSQENLVRAHHFGLFLQKVNLLKDQVDDLQHGRDLVPSRERMEISAQADAEGALRFLVDLPKPQIEFRRFCAWSLFLGLEALRVARRSVNEKRVLKIARHRTEQMLAEIEEVLLNDAALKEYFNKAAEGLGWRLSSKPEGWSAREIPAWLLRLYSGSLDGRHLGRLGLVELSLL